MKNQVGMDTQWRRLLPGVDETTLYNQVSAMYQDCHDDNEVAQGLSVLYDCEISRHMVRKIRTEMAFAAIVSKDVEVKRRWLFRHGQLTVNNLVKEYMMLEGDNRFLDAKLALAAELAGLSATHSKQQLWIAVNEALGRNNIPLDLINDLVLYHRRYIRLRRLVHEAGIVNEPDMNKSLLSFAARIETVYMGACGRDVNKTARYACKLLGLRARELKADDIRFLRDFYRNSEIPEASTAEMLIKLIQSTDSIQRKHSPMQQALQGNTGNLNAHELRQLVIELKNAPIPSPAHVRNMLHAARRGAARGGPAADGFLALAELLEKYGVLTNIDEFFEHASLPTTFVRKNHTDDYEATLVALNNLPDYQAVTVFVQQILRDSDSTGNLAVFANSYINLRFGNIPGV